MNEPFGLINNQTKCCWMNSIIQALVSCPHFVGAIQQSGADNEMVQAFRELIGANGDVSQYGARITALFRRMLKETNVADNMTNSQECAHESLIRMIELFNDEQINQTLHCVRTSCIICPQCGHMQERDEHDYYMTVYEHDYSDFNEVLLRHRHEQDYHECEHCGAVNHDVSATAVPKRMSPTLIVHFNKYRYKARTPLAHVISAPSASGGQLRWQLRAIIHHTGGNSNGHYTCTAWRGGHLYLLNDASYHERPQQFSDFDTHTVFLAVYSMIKN